MNSSVTLTDWLHSEHTVSAWLCVAIDLGFDGLKTYWKGVSVRVSQPRGSVVSVAGYSKNMSSYFYSRSIVFALACC